MNCLPISGLWSPIIKTRKLVLTAIARRDLRAIHAYIDNHNPRAADFFVTDLYDKIQRIAQLGLTGVQRQQAGGNLRSISYRDRVIHFRVSNSHIHVIRILHGRQNTSSQDFPESEI